MKEHITLFRFGTLSLPSALKENISSEFAMHNEILLLNLSQAFPMLKCSWVSWSNTAWVFIELRCLCFCHTNKHKTFINDQEKNFSINLIKNFIRVKRDKKITETWAQEKVLPSEGKLGWFLLPGLHHSWQNYGVKITKQVSLKTSYRRNCDFVLFTLMVSRKINFGSLTFSSIKFPINSMFIAQFLRNSVL